MAAAFLLWSMFTMALTSATVKSPTVDEGAKLAMGYSYARTLDLRFQNRHNHPRLAEMWIALPLLLDHRVPHPEDVVGWDESRNFFEYVANFYYRSPDVIRYTIAGRAQVVLLGVVLGALVFRWAAESFGARSALVACFMYVLSPTVLAHSRLMTNDVAAALGCMSVMYLAQRIVHRPSAWRAVILGVVLGVALLTKYSTLVLLPCLALWMAAAACVRRCPWSMRPSEPLKTVLIQAAAMLALILVVAAFVVWAGFGFEVRPARRVTLPIPVPAATLIDDVLRQRELGRGGPAYLLGHRWNGKRWYYTFAPLLFKSPVPTLVLVSVALVAAVRRRSLMDQLPLWLLPVVYTAVVCGNGGTTAHRYLLPALPFGFIFGSQVIGAGRCLLVQKPSRVAAMAMGAGYLACSIWIFPDYLAFFNLMAGGPGNGSRVLVGANLDWGQDLPQLQRYLEREAIDDVWLSAFSLTDPEAYGIRHRDLPDWEHKEISEQFHYANPTPGVYAISATLLQGVYLPNVSTFDWFHRRSPDSHVGYSMMVYSVRRDPSPPEWLGMCYAPDPSLHPEEIVPAFGRTDLRVVHFDCRRSWVFPHAASDGWYVVPAIEPGNSAMLSPWLGDAEIVFEQHRYGGGLEFTVYRSASTPPSLKDGSVVSLTSAALSPGPPAEKQSVVSRAPIAFDGPATFLGYEVRDPVLVAGREMGIDSVWRADGPVTDALPSVFAHLTDASGAVWATGDGLDFSAVQWQEGDVFVQKHALQVPSDLSPGRYWIALGLYDTVSGDRYPVEAAGPELDTLWIGSIEQMGGDGSAR